MDILQEFECCVEDVDEEKSTFWASMLDITEKSNPQEIAKMHMSLVAEEDRHLIQPGCIFYLRIGDGEYEIEVNKRVWTEEEIESAKVRAKELYNWLNERKA